MKSTALVIFTLALAGTALGQIDRNRSCLTGLPVTIGFSIEAVSIYLHPIKQLKNEFKFFKD